MLKCGDRACGITKRLQCRAKIAEHLRCRTRQGTGPRNVIACGFQAALAVVNATQKVVRRPVSG